MDCSNEKSEKDKMIDFLKKSIQKAKFEPKILGFCINNNYLIRRELNSQIKKNALNATGILLDFGCGTKPYQKYFTNVSRYIGIDLKIEGWEHRQDTVDFFYDGKTIPFEDNYFDTMLCTEVLEHVFNIEELLSEFQRVLKPNGTALITTPFMWEEHEMPHDFGRYTTPALIYLYEKYGFEIVSHHKTGNNIKVIAQFSINYVKSLLPANKILKQILLVPFIIYFNFVGSIFGFLLPGDKSVYFNNVFVLRKK